jgi:hypothetical protein
MSEFDKLMSILLQLEKLTKEVRDLVRGHVHDKSK